MLSVQDAFKKFKSNLELTEKEQQDASRRQKEIRSVIDSAFAIDRDFLTGSYARWTKTKPLKDVDIFCVLADKERHYRSEPPSVLLDDFKRVLAEEYGKLNVSSRRRSITVSFEVAVAEDKTDDRVMSFDVVPAFTKKKHYEIPDTAVSSGWTETNPDIHAEKAKAAQDAFSGEWKGLVRMMKKWNEQVGKVIKPSFLIEVMALEVLHPPYCEQYRREMKAFFATLAARIDETWPDPAGLGPPVSDMMDTQKCEAAKAALIDGERQAANAIWLEQEGKGGDALKTWRALFGPLFPLS